MRKIYSLSAALMIAFLSADAQNIPSDQPNSAQPTNSYGLPGNINISGAASTLNFSRVFVPHKATTSTSDPIFNLQPGSGVNYSASVQTSYLNGWGSKLETIRRGAPGVSGSSSNDIIIPFDLRPSHVTTSLLPYTLSPSSHFQGNPFGGQEDYYDTHYTDEYNTAYSQSSSYYDNLTPTTQSYMPGVNFVGNGNGVTASTSIDASLSIKKYITLDNGAIADASEYADNQLTVHTVAGQHDALTKTFSEKDGKVVCKQVYDGSQMLTTYYVYDQLGRMAAVLTPKAVSIGLPLNTLNTLSYTYQYNNYGQLISATKPGKQGADVAVYDSRHRAVLTQTPLQATNGQYTFVLYDTRDRVILSGTLNSSHTRADWQGWLSNPGTATYSSGDLLDLLINGTNGSYPSSIPNCVMDVINYYDQYPSFAPGFDNSLSGVYLTGSNYIAPVPYLFAKDMLTASKVRIKDPNDPTIWATNVMYYDQKGRLIETLTRNPFNGSSFDVNLMQYNFNGQVVQQLYRYNDVAGSPNAVNTVATLYTYDMYHDNRLMTVQQKINDNQWRNLSSYTYDDMGRVQRKSLGGVEVQDYTYNIRGQLTGINSDFAQTDPITVDNKHFGCILDYDYGFTSPRYDGSLSGMIWRNGGAGAPLNAYGYNYDAAHRLVEADYREHINTGAWYWDNGDVDYTMDNTTYDENGNIQTMHQRTTMQNGPVDMDNLHYHYADNSNQLANVVDDVPENNNTGDFVSQAADTHCDGCTYYQYDADGNMSEDDNKGISNITYNERGLPTDIQFTAGGEITNVYDGNGTLITRTVNDGQGTTDVYRYWGGFVYKNDVLQYIMNAEGRARYIPADSDFPFHYDYFVKDHLGNVRATVTADPETAKNYFAGHEVAAANVENAMFSNIDNVRDPKAGASDANDNMAARLNGNDSSRRIGTAIILHVMAGDKLDISAQSYWQQDSTAPRYEAGSPMMDALVSTLAGATAAAGGEGVRQSVVGGITPSGYNTYDALVDSIASTSVPRAFINYMVFDENMQLQAAQSGALQVNAQAGSWGPMQTPQPLAAQQSGYVVIYMSNAQLQDVYMDNMSITFYHGNLLQQQDYYPFGLAVKGVPNATTLATQFLFEGNEVKDDLGLNLGDFHNRQYDYQLGRFTSIDPLADQNGQELYSPYHFCGNNPANFTDPWGLDFSGGTLPLVTIIGHRFNQADGDDVGHELENMLLGNGTSTGGRNMGWDGPGGQAGSGGGGGMDSAMQGGKIDPNYHFKAAAENPVTKEEEEMNKKYLAKVEKYLAAHPQTGGGETGSDETGDLFTYTSLGLSTQEVTLDYVSTIASNPAVSETLDNMGRVTGVAAHAVDLLYVGEQVNEYNNGDISGERVSYHLGTTLSANVAGVILGGEVGLAIGIGAFAAEEAYDGYTWVMGQLGEASTTFNNAMLNGWVPGR